MPQILSTSLSSRSSILHNSTDAGNLKKIFFKEILIMNYPELLDKYLSSGRRVTYIYPFNSEIFFLLAFNAGSYRNILIAQQNFQCQICRAIIQVIWIGIFFRIEIIFGWWNYYLTFSMAFSPNLWHDIFT